MTNNPLAAQIKKEEKLYSSEIGTRVTKALQDKALQKKLDAATNSSSAKPPKPVQALYDKALAKQQQAIAKEYAGLQVVITPSFKMNGAYWRGSATAKVTYPLTKRGGKKHKVKPGDTLWALAETYYGAGYYWSEIEKANPKQVACKGDFILAGTTLTIPALDVVPGNSSQPVVIQKTKTAPKAASKKARPVAMPVMELELDKSGSHREVIKTPGMTLIFTFTLTGSLKAQTPGTLPANFNLSKYEAEIKNGAKPFQTSFKVKGGKVDSIAIASNVSGTTWASKLSWSRTGAVKLSMKPKPVKFKEKGIIYEGNVGIDLEIQAIPDPKSPAPEPVKVTDQIGDWFAENGRVLAGAALVTAAVGLVVVTVGEDIVTLGVGIADDPVSFAAAGVMAQQGLRMIR